MVYTPMGIENFFEENSIDYLDLSYSPEVFYLLPYINILKREGVLEIDTTLPIGSPNTRMNIYLLSHENKPGDQVLFFINWQESRNLTVTYTVDLDVGADFCERYWENEREKFYSKRKKR